ncbi:MAG: glycine cleavage T C-terminal barrel domain-containing protein [Bacteroidota bacterium]|nr:glycine cleavage T C-terminal barrel domain-containing protein [Bacteroidota bacterium]MDP4230222.1 glycine cleavage T C-terminal barrel domain-containing protein [Bacteroidota bacterium]MDP4237406.1 glycine cleavage T C-terminal barrel domain-containing protein [Bacteroidota bacterium]
MNIESYEKAHRSLALFDASEKFGRIRATGADAIDLLHRMSTNELLSLVDKPGAGAQTVLTTEKGRIIDLLTVLSQGKGALLISSGRREDQVIEWLNKFVIMEDAKFEKISASLSQLLVFGPQALSFLQQFTETSLIGLQNFHFLELNIQGVPVMLQKTHRIIESGWAIFADASKRSELKQFLQKGIEAAGGTVLDDDTYNLLRIEAGIPTAPNELNEKHNPLETTLVQAISWTKGCYIGQEVIARLDTYDKVQRHLMGIKIEGAFANGSLPVAIVNSDGEAIGEITSLAFSPLLENSIGLAFIKTAYAIPDMSANVGDAKVPAKLTKLPFEI